MGPVSEIRVTKYVYWNENLKFIYKYEYVRMYVLMFCLACQRVWGKSWNFAGG